MTKNPIKLFVSYSHRDEAYRRELDSHISPLVREDLVSVWYDRKISPGSLWEIEISSQLYEAEVHLLLVSPDFFASDYCYGKEMSVAIEKHNRGDTRVLPIVIRPVDWTHSKLARIQALPKDAIPVSLSDNRDAAWLSVITGIREVCTQALRHRERKEPQSQLSPVSLIGVLGDVVQDIERLYNRDDPASITGISTGLNDLDALTDGLHPGELNVIASAPMMDREGLLIRVTTHVSYDLKLPVAFICTQLDTKYVGSRLLTSSAHLSVGRMRSGTLSDVDWERMSIGLAKAYEAPLELVPAPNAPVSDVLRLLDQMAEKYGALPLIVIDSLAHFAEDKVTVIRQLRDYVNRSRKTIIAGIGLENDPGERIDARPLISDLGRWAAIDENIDCLMLLYFEQVYRPDTADIGVAEVIVAKSRHKGRGTVKLAYLAESQCFENLAVQAC